MKLKHLFFTLIFLGFINCNKSNSSNNSIVGNTYYLVQNESLVLCTMDIKTSNKFEELIILTFSKCLLSREVEFIGSYDKATNSIKYQSLSRNKEIVFSEDGNFGFDGKTEKLSLISKVYYENLTPNERTTVLNKKLE